jgi:hypothetical protein
VKLIFVLAIIFGKVFFINLFEIVEIVRTFRIYTFMDDKVFPVFLANKGMLAMRTLEGQLVIKSVITGSECSLADLTQYLTCLAVIFVEIRLRSMT